jgi:hypothetical protein
VNRILGIRIFHSTMEIIDDCAQHSAAGLEVRSFDERTEQMAAVSGIIADQPYP